MRKIIAMVSAALVLAFCASGCACGRASGEDGNRLSVVTTIFAPYDFVRQIAGDRVECRMLLKPGTEAHSYEPTPQDIIMLTECDLFIYVGGENDAWVEDILSSVDASGMRTIKLLDCVEKRYEEEAVEGMDTGRGHGHGAQEDRAEWDEHVWTSPLNAVLISEAIAGCLAELDPDNAGEYGRSMESYRAELEALDREFREIAEKAGHNTLVFGDRFPLRYFTEEYGLEYYAAFPGCASETEASAATIAFLIDKVRDDKIPIVFKIELSNGNMARTVAAEGGARVETFYTGHNLTRQDYENGETYITLMYRNAELLREALD